MCLCAATIAQRLAEIRRFEGVRAAAGQPPPPENKFPSWLMNAVAKPRHRLLRLHFLAEQVTGSFIEQLPSSWPDDCG